jgi:hypothetical protein
MPSCRSVTSNKHVIHCIHVGKVKQAEKKLLATIKAIPLQVWTGPEGSRMLGLPDLKTIST